MHIKNLTEIFRPVEGSDNRSQKGKVERAGREDSSTKGDRVSLSEAAQLYKAAQQAAHDGSGIRTKMVSQIKEQVVGGTYEMNSRKTAEKMLEQEFDLWRGDA